MLAVLAWWAASVGMGVTMAFGGMTASRSIEAGFRAGEGNAYETEVAVSAEGAVPSSMILQEVLPEGWMVERATWNGADMMPRQVSGGTNKWLFGLGVEPGAGVLRYVTRTSQAEELAYSISGCLTYLDGGGQVVVETTGDAVVWAMDSDSDGRPDDWERKYYGGGTACDAVSDTDGDGMSALDEFAAGSDPTDDKSFLRVQLTFTNGAPRVSWEPNRERGRIYVVEGTSNLSDPGSWTTKTNANTRFFRIKVGFAE